MRSSHVLVGLVLAIAFLGLGAAPADAEITFRASLSGWMGPGSNADNVWTAQLDADPALELIMVRVFVGGHVAQIVDGNTFMEEASSPTAPYSIGGGIASTLSDIDGDGLIEVLVGAFDGGNAAVTHVFDTDVAAAVAEGEVLPGMTAPTLGQNYPNPLNPTTTIRYEIGSAGPVSLRIYDVQGALVRTLVDGERQEAGPHRTSWDGRDNSGHPAASGQYYYQVVTPEGSSARKMILLR